MKNYEIGDKVTLEVKPKTLGCAGCFFNDSKTVGCDVFCKGVDGNTIWAKVEDTSQIDWEQRRYEIAKDVYCRNPGITEEEAIWNADTLIKELKRIKVNEQ